jgi:hypothetical protein
MDKTCEDYSDDNCGNIATKKWGPMRQIWFFITLPRNCYR